MWPNPEQLKHPPIQFLVASFYIQHHDAGGGVEGGSRGTWCRLVNRVLGLTVSRLCPRFDLDVSSHPQLLLQFLGNLALRRVLQRFLEQ